MFAQIEQTASVFQWVQRERFSPTRPWQEISLSQQRIQSQQASILHKLINDYLDQYLLARYDHLFGEASTYDGTISDIGEVVGGATPSKKKPEYYCHRGIGRITPRDLSNTNNKFIAHGSADITQEGFNSCSIQKLPAGTVLFSSRAPIGYLAIAVDEVTTNHCFLDYQNQGAERCHRVLLRRRRTALQLLIADSR